MTPVFEIFDLIGSLFHASHDVIGPLFLQKKISLSLSYLVPEILGLNVGLIFH